MTEVPVHRGPVIDHRPIADADLDPDAVRIVKRLTRFEHQAYLVGGCVRDLLLDRSPKDFDIGTSATPRQVKRLFSNCRIIGRRFRLAHVYFQNGKIIEVATFRALDTAEDPAPAEAGETESEDLLIRDDNVFGTAEEDALRRDFTINQLFYDVNEGNVIDHADGLGDLRRRLVRTIGDPATRFREDPIRILRAIKFAARLDFEIEEKTLEALRRTCSEIPKAAPPRVLEELNRFCRGGAGRRSFELAFETGAFDVILPELAEAYGSADRRAYLGALLDAADRRDRVHEIATGEILAMLLLPILAPRFGWGEGGTVDPPRGGVPVREIVDDLLRPAALRLRMSRRDQEECRQILTIVQRMVPARNVRKGLRQALSRRPSFANALRLLGVLADLRGGEFREAAELWSDGPPRVESPAAPASPDAARRRRRRGGRGRGRRQGETAAAPPAPAPAAKPRESGKPSVWSDDYFFAALPSVPPSEEGDAGPDRYGAEALAAATRPARDAESDPDPAKPRRRRSRRGGRGRGRSGGGASGDANLS